MTGPTGSGRGCLPWLLGLAALAGVGLLLLLVLPGWLSGEDQPRDDRPGAAATSSATPAAPPPSAPPGFTVILPEQAGGLDLFRPGGPETAARQESMINDGIAVVDLVGGGYEDEDGTLAVDFHGGRLTDPQLARSARDTLETAFRASFPNLTPSGESQQYDAGELGGEVWCTRYELTVASVCGWVDEWTIGFVFAIGADEADLAALLVAMRADAEVPG